MDSKYYLSLLKKSGNFQADRIIDEFDEDSINLFIIGDVSKIEEEINTVYKIFEEEKNDIANKNSNGILKSICGSLNGKNGFMIENGHRIKMSYVVDDKTISSFYIDGFNELKKIVFEIECGRAIENNNILRDLFKCLSCNCLEKKQFAAEYLIIAVPNTYGPGKTQSPYIKTIELFMSLFLSGGGKFSAPLKGIAIIGYKKNHS